MNTNYCFRATVDCLDTFDNSPGSLAMMQSREEVLDALFSAHPLFADFLHGDHETLLMRAVRARSDMGVKIILLGANPSVTVGEICIIYYFKDDAS
jgi:hypothetical protein